MRITISRSHLLFKFKFIHKSNIIHRFISPAYPLCTFDLSSFTPPHAKVFTAHCLKLIFQVSHQHQDDPEIPTWSVPAYLTHSGLLVQLTFYSSSLPGENSNISLHDKSPKIQEVPGDQTPLSKIAKFLQILPYKHTMKFLTLIFSQIRFI